MKVQCRVDPEKRHSCACKHHSSQFEWTDWDKRSFSQHAAQMLVRDLRQSEKKRCARLGVGILFQFRVKP